MFDIGWSEMAVILLVALIVIGPKDLPRVARTMGRWAGKGRAMAREFQTALEDMAREAELDKVKSEIEKAARTDVGKTIEKTIDPSGELGKAFDPRSGSGTRPGGETPDGAPAAAAPAKAADGPPPAKAAADEPSAKGALAKPAPANSSPAKSSPAKPSPAKPSGEGERPKVASSSERTEPVRETAPAEPS